MRVLRRLCWTSGQQAHLLADCGRFDGEFHYFCVSAQGYSELGLYVCFVIGFRNNVVSLGSSDVLQQFSSLTDVLGYLLLPFRCPDSHGADSFAYSVIPGVKCSTRRTAQVSW